MNNFKDVIKDLQETECLSDVTLVCNDNSNIKAHKFVLIGSSPVLRAMLLKSSHRDTIVYLRGVDRNELEWLLQFMYLGQAQVPQTQLQSFIELAKDLKMKGIYNEDTGKTIENAEDKPVESNAIKNEIACEERKMVDHEKETIQNIKLSDLEMHHQSFNLGEDSRYSCNHCPYTTKASKSELKRHIQKEHEGVRYPCDHCTYQAKSKQNLKDHKASVHKVNPVFRCMVCDYCTNHSTGWKKHSSRCNSSDPNSSYTTRI